MKDNEADGGVISWQLFDGPFEHHFDCLRKMRFFAGTRDQFCNLGLLRKVLSYLTAPWDLEIIDGGDHSFNMPKSIGTDPQAICGRILNKIPAWLGE